MSEWEQDRASERVRNISTILIFTSRRVAVKNGGARDVSLALLLSARQRAASGRRQSTFLQKTPRLSDNYPRTKTVDKKDY
jgi:hypothetical protein